MCIAQRVRPSISIKAKSIKSFAFKMTSSPNWVLGIILRSMEISSLLQKLGTTTWDVPMVETPEVNAVSTVLWSLLQAPLLGAHFPIQIIMTITR